MYAGIDYSYTSPSICIGPSKDVNKCKMFFYTDKKKFQGKFGNNVFGIAAPPYESQIERFHNISEWAMSILLKFNVTDVCLEGYAMGSTGSRVFNIGENTAILKYRMWQNNIRYITPAPTAVKKHFTGKGNAKKPDMHDSFVELTGLSIADLLQSKPDSNPVSDIVDGYAMLHYGITEGL